MIIIHQPQSHTDSGKYPKGQENSEPRIKISALIEFTPDPQSRKGLSRRLYFDFPLSSKPSLDCEPFVVALLLVAMQNNEPIWVKGSLSKILLKGLDQYQAVYHFWYPKRFHPIKITCDSTYDAEQLPGLSQGTAFSGGVDSFYTFLKERKNLTHALYMSGFDMPLHLKKSAQELIDSYSELMTECGITLIHGKTNIREFVNTVDWTNAHGQALAASALFFKDQWKCFYIPASYSKNNHPKWGTHPELDPLLSTDTLKFIHHGADHTRVEKLMTVSLHSETFNRLRVCWIQDLGLKNCSVCEKCVRTLTALEILGVLNSYTTFLDKTHLHQKVRRLPHRTHQGRLFAKELAFEALARLKFGLFFSLTYSLLRRYLKVTFSNLLSHKSKTGKKRE
jgi:hypothetical protein